MLISLDTNHYNSEDNNVFIPQQSFNFTSFKSELKLIFGPVKQKLMRTPAFFVKEFHILNSPFI